MGDVQILDEQNLISMAGFIHVGATIVGAVFIERKIIHAEKLNLFSFLSVFCAIVGNTALILALSLQTKRSENPHKYGIFATFYMLVNTFGSYSIASSQKRALPIVGAIYIFIDDCLLVFEQVLYQIPYTHW